VRCGVDVVHEPGRRSDRGPNTERSILTPDERFKVIVDDGFGQGRKTGAAPGMQQDGVAAKAFGHPGDGGL
jgi:hypothetical protein